MALRVQNDAAINRWPHSEAFRKLLLTLPAQIFGRGAHKSGIGRANGEFAVLEFKIRPTSVAGPLGLLTIDDLPSSCTTYWVSRRKAQVLAAIDGGLLALKDACDRYRLSPEELAAWRRSVERAGIPGLRVTKMREYRGRYNG